MPESKGGNGDQDHRRPYKNRPFAGDKDLAPDPLLPFCADGSYEMALCPVAEINQISANARGGEGLYTVIDSTELSPLGEAS